MEEVTFKREGFWYWLHNMTFMLEPEDTCTYRNRIGFSIILNMLFLPAFLTRLAFIGLFNKKLWYDDFRMFGFGPTFIYMIFYGLILVIASALAEQAGEALTFIYYLMSAGYFIGTFSVLGLLAYVASKIHDWKEAREFDRKHAADYVEPGPGTFKKLYIAWKNKYCSKIKWEN